MENNKNDNYNKSYEKSYNNKRREMDVTKQIQEFDKKLEKKQTEMSKELEQKQLEISKMMEEKKEEVIRSLNENLEEQIKTSVSKKLREEEKKIIGNKNRKIIVRDFIIILLIAVIGFLAYCLYDLDFYNIKTIVNNKDKIDNAIANNDLEKVNNVIEEDNNNNEEKKDEQKEEVKSSKYYIDNYSYLVDNIQITGTNELYLYKKPINKEEISNNIKLQIAYKNMDNTNKKIKEGMISFKAEDLLKSCKEIFGNDITLNNEIFGYNNNKFLYHDNTYLGLLADGDKIDSNVVYKIENAYEKDSKLTFEIIAAKRQEGKLINIQTEEVLSELYNNEDIAIYKDRLSKYKFIYTKVEDNYYFEKVEVEGNEVEILNIN